MKNFKFSLAMLCLFFAAFPLLKAQTFTIHQDYSYTSNCGQSPVLVIDENIPATVATVSLFTSHNITSLTSVKLPSNINDHCWRFIHFDVFDVVNGIETLEGRVTKTGHWIDGALTFNGSTTTDFDLTVEDLIKAGIGSGTKTVRLSVEYRFVGDIPYVVNLVSTLNGNPLCSLADVTSSNTPFVCNAGSVVCFDYIACDAVLSANGFVTLVLVSDGGPNYWAFRYTFGATMTGGSGNFSYSWTVTGLPNVTSNNSSFVFITNQPIGAVLLEVVDNVTGCVYNYNSREKQATLVQESPLDMQLAPNPVKAGNDLGFQYLLPEAGTVSFDLYDLQGRHVRHLGQHNGQLGKNEFRSGSSGLSQGTYIVRMSSGKAGVVNRRVVIQ